MPGHKLSGFLIDELALMCGGELSNGEAKVETTRMGEEPGSIESEGDSSDGFWPEEEKGLVRGEELGSFEAKNFNL